MYQSMYQCMECVFLSPATYLFSLLLLLLDMDHGGLL